MLLSSKVSQISCNASKLGGVVPLGQAHTSWKVDGALVGRNLGSQKSSEEAVWRLAVPLLRLLSSSFYNIVNFSNAYIHFRLIPTKLYTASLNSSIDLPSLSVTLSDISTGVESQTKPSLLASVSTQVSLSSQRLSSTHNIWYWHLCPLLSGGHVQVNDPLVLVQFPPNRQGSIGKQRFISIEWIKFARMLT